MNWLILMLAVSVGRMTALALIGGGIVLARVTT
jgi:hypothetical protein